MSLIPYYLQYLSEICEGTRQAPEGLALSEQDDLKKALQLQAGIAEMGIPAFVRACAAIMDKALHRLEQEGEMELAAALLSGDETTFKLFRTQAPELVHLPDATYEWYCKNYLDRYYPVRFILHHQGIEFPQA